MRAIAAVLLSAAFYGLLFPPFAWAPLSWIALVPLLLAVRGRTPAVAAGLGGLFGLVTTGLIILWLVPTLNGHFERSLFSTLAFLGFVSLTALAPYTAAAMALYVRVQRRIPRALVPLVFAAAWVALELARTHLGIRSPWTKLGDAHFASERLRQIADLGGVYAVSGLVALGNAVFAEGVHFAWRQRRGLPVSVAPLRWSTTVFVLLCTAALLYGEARRGPSSPGDAALDVVVVQGNVAPTLRWRRATASRVLHRYANLTREALLHGGAPDLVVWPENAVQTSLDDPVYGASLRALPRRGISFLVGAPRAERWEGRHRQFNSALLLRPETPPAHYDKRRLLPFSETQPLGRLGSFGGRGDLDQADYTPGDRPGIFRFDGTMLGVMICMEALYPELAREAAREGATVLVNLSNDGWYGGRGGAEQHLAQIVFRAIETRLPLIRSTTTGVSAIVAPDGRITARIASHVGDFLRAKVPASRRSESVYTRVGDLFAFSCVAACLLAGAATYRGGAVAARRGPTRPVAQSQGNP